MHTNRSKTRAAVLLVASAALVGTAALPASAHGEDGEADPVETVRQALAIVINTPGAADEATERIEEVLAVEADEPSGELDVAALEDAADAIEAGRLGPAEQALLAALAADRDGQTADVLGHGPTDRLTGGLRGPSAGEGAAFAAAALAGLGGIGLIRRHGGER